MKKKRLDWQKIWKEFNKRTHDGLLLSWEQQKGVIMHLVESARNEKPRERKRKTVK